MDGKIGCRLSWYQPDMPIVNNYLKQTGALIQEGSMLFFVAIGAG